MENEKKNDDLQPGEYWEWESGEWVKRSMPVASDEDYDAMLRLMPATAWNILASIVDGGGFKAAQNEDVRHIKEFICRVTRHKRFAQMLQDAIIKRQGG